MIIDVHAHVGPWFFSMDVSDPSVNLDLMERFHIDLQLVSSTEAVVYDPSAGNHRLASILPATGGRLAGMLVVDPRRLDTARMDLEELIPAGGFLGAKIHTAYTTVPIASSAMTEAVRLTSEFELPTLIHTWGSDIVDLARLAACVPDARLIAGHMGGPSWDLIPEAAAISDRVWFEPSWSTTEAGRLRWAIDSVGASRLLFGTDATLVDPSVALGVVEAAQLDDGEREAMMAGNALALFRLKGA